VLGEVDNAAWRLVPVERFGDEPVADSVPPVSAAACAAASCPTLASQPRAHAEASGFDDPEDASGSSPQWPQHPFLHLLDRPADQRSRYRFGALLGKGAFGKVFAATRLDLPNDELAIKSISGSRVGLPGRVHPMHSWDQSVPVCLARGSALGEFLNGDRCGRLGSTVWGHTLGDPP
jgi:hypothetical protein